LKPIRHLCVLAVGAFVTIAIAWGSAVTNNLETSRPTEWRQVRGNRRLWVARTRNGFAGTRVYASHMRVEDVIVSDTGEYDGVDAIPEWGGFASRSPEMDLTHANRITRVGEGRGWPFIALWCEVESLIEGPSGRQVVIGRGSLKTPWIWEESSSGTPRLLPLRPVWPGFVADVSIYAASVAIGAYAAWRMRAKIRRYRHRCPHCGYDLRSLQLPGCPECGWNRPESERVASLGGSLRRKSLPCNLSNGVIDDTSTISRVNNGASGVYN
jgi:hypothetical protein